MLEIPESHTIADQLNKTVRKKKIMEAEAGHTSHAFAWYTIDPSEYEKIMAGKILGEARGIGCMVEMDLEEYRFVVGDGANIRYYQAGVKLPARYQTRVTFEDGSSLICTVQMYGAMYLFLPDKFDNYYYASAKEKPMPGTKAFDYPYFDSLVKQAEGGLSIKQFLAADQRIPGIGNGVLQDILLESGLHPRNKIGALKEPDWKRVYNAVINILEQMTKAGGRDTEKDLFGNPGRYRTKLSKKTVGSPCPYCGGEILKMTYLGGTVYFCPQCQPLC